jgi:hypothetical protein
MVTYLCNMVADDTDGCYKLFCIQLQYQFSLLHILQHVTQAIIVQYICLCSNILMTQNNSAPCSVGHIPEHLWGDTIKIKSHCFLKAISGLVALLCNNLLYIFAGVTIHCGHTVRLDLPSTVLHIYPTKLFISQVFGLNVPYDGVTQTFCWTYQWPRRFFI